MCIEFDKKDEIKALDLEWDDPINKDAGGEFKIIRKTIENRKSRTLIENAAWAFAALSDSLLVTLKKGISHSLLHSFCWHVIQDLKTSMYLAMSGRYRQAHIIRR